MRARPFLSLLAGAMLPIVAGRPGSAQTEGGAVLVLPRPQAIPFERLRATTLAGEVGFASLSYGRVVPLTARVQRESGRLGVAAGGGSLFPARSTLRAGWIVGAGAALQVRADPQLLWHPGIAVYTGGTYRRIGLSGGGQLPDTDVPIGANFSISGPLSGKLARVWLAPRAELRFSGKAGSGAGGGATLGLMLLNTKGTGAQLGFRVSGDFLRIRDPRLDHGVSEWGVRIGVLRLARAHEND